VFYDAFFWFYRLFSTKPPEILGFIRSMAVLRVLPPAKTGLALVFLKIDPEIKPPLFGTLVLF
jgi:hypothetical protein